MLRMISHCTIEIDNVFFLREEDLSQAISLFRTLQGASCERGTPTMNLVAWPIPSTDPSGTNAGLIIDQHCWGNGGND